MDQEEYTMYKETNLEQAKHVAIAFLNLEPKRVAPFPTLVYHPYLDCSMIPGINGGIVDIFEDPQSFEAYKKKMESVIWNGNLDTIFAYIRKPYQLSYLKHAKSFLSKKDFDTYLAYVWISSENPNQDVNVPIRTLISWFKQANRKYLMEPQELQYYNQLPPIVKIYRGVAVGRAQQEGLSWTCNYNTAAWFANRFNTANKNGYIIQGEIRKEDIFAYFNGRNEDEILCNSAKVFNKTKIQL